MSYNIQHAATSVEEIGAVIREAEPDLVGLQEVDVNVGRSGNRDQPAELAALTGLEGYFVKAIPLEEGEYGLALLSRFPVRSVQRIPLPSSSEGHIMALFEVEIAPDRVVPVAVNHWDLEEEKRQEQARVVVATLAGKSNAILIGDFNATVGSLSLGILMPSFNDSWDSADSQADDGLTYPARGPYKRIDFVFLAPDWAAPTSVQVPATTASDHRPLVVNVPLGS